MLACLVESPPVDTVANVWQTESNQPMPPRRSKTVWLTVRIR